MTLLTILSDLSDNYSLQMRKKYVKTITLKFIITKTEFLVLKTFNSDNTIVKENTTIVLNTKKNQRKIQDLPKPSLYRGQPYGKNYRSTYSKTGRLLNHMLIDGIVVWNHEDEALDHFLLHVNVIYLCT